MTPWQHGIAIVIGLCLVCLLTVSRAQTDPPRDDPRLAASTMDTLLESSQIVPKQEGLKFLGAPYVYANTDMGLVMGVGGGLSKPPNFYSLFFVDGSFNGMLQGGVSMMEIKSGDWRFIDVSWISQKLLYIYTLSDNDPQILAGALQTQYELNFSALHDLGGGWEAGPTVLVRFMRSREARDLVDPNNPGQSVLYSEGRNIPKSTYPRFRDADVELAGYRFRYTSTSPVRPTDGWIFETALRAGRTDGDAYATPRFDMDFEARLARAIPLTHRSRLYLRGWTILQLEAPPPVQQFLGWDRNHRGQPFMREWGRRFLSGRIQYHWMFAENSRFPWGHLHSLWSALPDMRLHYEIVPFYDIGAVGDPAFGWHETRHALGIGIHAVLPPDLVFRLDFAIAPGGPLRFFLAAGEGV